MSTATLLVLLVLALIRLPLTYLLSLLLPDATVAPAVYYVSAMAQSLLLLALPGWLLERKAACAPGRTANSCLWVMAAACLGVAAAAALAPLNRWWTALLGVQGTPIPQASGAAEKTLQLLACAIVPAVAEEVFFRGALLRSLRRERGSIPALVITTFAFALMHGSLAGLPGHLALSLLLTLLMLRTDRLVALMTAHLAYNAAILTGLRADDTVAWLCGAALVLTGLGMALAIRRERRSAMPLHEGLLAGLALIAMAALYLI